MKNYFQISIGTVVHYSNVIGTLSNNIVGILLNSVSVIFK